MIQLLFSREIFAVLDVMKMDMANFTIQQMRPYLQQQSMEYEKTKFDEFLKTQRGEHFILLFHFFKKKKKKLLFTPYVNILDFDGLMAVIFFM